VIRSGIHSEVAMDDRIRTDSDFGAAVRRDVGGDPAGVAIAPWPGIEQGLASLALGMALFIGGAPTMLLMHVLWHSGFDGFNRLDRVLLTIFGVLGVLMVLTCAVFGLVFGISAMVAARRRNRPAALGLAGVLLNGFNVLLWLFILVNWVLAVASRAF
jgi:hypothetical protein